MLVTQRSSKDVSYNRRQTSNICYLKNNRLSFGGYHIKSDKDINYSVRCQYLLFNGKLQGIRLRLTQEAFKSVTCINRARRRLVDPLQFYFSGCQKNPSINRLRETSWNQELDAVPLSLQGNGCFPKAEGCNLTQFHPNYPSGIMIQGLKRDGPG